MSADNVLLFTLLWTFTAVCQADDDISVICDDVTGSVEKEVILTCRVSLQNTDCCIRNYRFLYPESFEDSVICKNWFPRDSCAQRNSFTCHYTPTTATTQPFRFFLVTTCGMKTTQFTVDIKEPLKHEADPEAPGEILEADPEKGLGAEVIIIPGVIGFIFIIIFISSIVIICVKRLKNSNASGSQNRYERGASEEQTVMTTNI